jgi:hypothetical protein
MNAAGAELPEGQYTTLFSSEMFNFLSPGVLISQKNFMRTLWFRKTLKGERRYTSLREERVLT